jgi:hypothetical protein
MVFGFTSLTHGPVMAMQAAAAQPCHDAVPVQVEHGGHHAAHMPAASTPAPADERPAADKICPMPGCFVMVSPSSPPAPLARIAAERLEPALARFMDAAAPEPADPPPRLPA